MNRKIALLFLLVLGVVSCNLKSKKDDMSKETNIKIETTAGDVVIKLYNETPQHRDNFIKLVNDKTYEGTLFHRVINEFMIQAGDPDSKNATKGQMLGSGDVGYTIPAEFDYPALFHKKGALSAARQGDQVNPKKASSGCQFYVVTGKVFSEEEIISLEQQMNESKIHAAFSALVQTNMQEINKLRQEQDEEGLMNLQDRLIEEAEKEAAKEPDFKFTPEQIEAYTSIGGTPHLDREYTVFGEVVDGLDVVDQIQGVETDQNDRPLEDVKIVKMSLIK